MDPAPPDRRAGERRHTRPSTLGPGPKRVSVWIDRQMFTRIESIAETNHVEVSVCLRQLIKRGLRIPEF